MADSDAILAALLGTGGAGLDPLSNFQKATASNDMLKMAAAPVLQAKFDNSTWSPLQTFGTSAAQAFLGTLLHGLGQRQEDEQLMKVAAVYPQLAKDPLSVAVPEGVDSTAFNALRLGQLQKNAALEEARAQKIADAVFASQLKGEESRLTELGRIKGRNEGYGFGLDSVTAPNVAAVPGAAAAIKDPESPMYKISEDRFAKQMQLQKELMTGNEATKSLSLNKAARNILEAIKNDSPLAASSAIFEFAKLQDPSGTVREGDEMRVSDAGGPLGKLAQVFNEVQQKGKLLPESKAAMRQLVPMMVQSQFDQYNQLKDAYLSTAQQYGLDPTKLQYVKPIDLSSYLQEQATQPAGLSEQASTIASMLPKSEDDQLAIIAQLEDLRKAAQQAPVGSLERAQIQARAKSLLSRGNIRVPLG